MITKGLPDIRLSAMQIPVGRLLLRICEEGIIEGVCGDAQCLGLLLESTLFVND